MLKPSSGWIPKALIFKLFYTGGGDIPNSYLPNYTSELLRHQSVWSFSNSTLLYSMCWPPAVWIRPWVNASWVFWQLEGFSSAGQTPNFHWTVIPLAARGHAVTILCSCEVTERYGFVIYRCRQKALWVGKDLRDRLCSLQLLNNADLRNVQERIMNPLLCVWKWFSVLNVFSKTFSCSVEHLHGECVCEWNGTRGWNATAAEACWWITSPLPLSCFKSACQKCTDWIKRAGKSNRIWRLAMHSSK